MAACAVAQKGKILLKGSALVNYYLFGRVGALLELGAGFNPEDTGRENIVTTGLLNGLNRKQINETIDGIVEFADIGDFIDLPVKFYSSGMFMRTAFSAVVFHHPDILIIDEALSVGDANFQAKCYAQIRSLVSDRRTIIKLIILIKNTCLISAILSSSIQIGGQTATR